MSSLAGRLRANVAAADPSTAAAMLLNFGSSTGIVIGNKLVMEQYGFRFATTLTLIHFLATYVLLLLCVGLRVFERKRLPLQPVAKLAAGSMGFVVLTNLSLQYNSVGFYQVMKVMTTPTVVVIEALFFAKFLEGPLKLALVPVCAGVVFTAATDFRLNMVGTLFAVAGVLVTSCYQIGAGSLQKSLDCSALQLQLYTAPLSALFILPFVPLFDNWSVGSATSIWEYEFTRSNLGAILATGTMAFLVNVSIFWVIGRSSAVSYNTLGHFKTCFILVSVRCGYGWVAWRRRGLIFCLAACVDCFLRKKWTSHDRWSDSAAMPWVTVAELALASLSFIRVALPLTRPNIFTVSFIVSALLICFPSLLYVSWCRCGCHSTSYSLPTCRTSCCLAARWTSSLWPASYSP